MSPSSSDKPRRIDITRVDEAHAAQAIEQIFSSDDDGGASDFQKPD